MALALLKTNPRLYLLALSPVELHMPAPHLASPSIRRLAHEAQQRFKASGRCWCFRPPLGYRWHGTRKGRRRLVEDQGERQTASAIVAMRERGMSWYRIAAVLLWAGEVTKHGMEWSPSRCRRIYAAAQAGRLAALDGLVPLGLKAVKDEAHRRGQARRRREYTRDFLNLAEWWLKGAQMQR
jgi:hypothetical protein